MTSGPERPNAEKGDRKIAGRHGLRIWASASLAFRANNAGMMKRAVRSNRHGESKPCSSRTFGEGRRPARRLYADRADRFWRNGLPDSMQGVSRTTTGKGRRAETRCCGREAHRKALGRAGASE